eukprot:4498199-Amphidinium_carterae.1
MKANQVLEEFLRTGSYSLVQGAVAQKEEERVQGLRREQRQRYKTRKKQAADEIDSKAYAKQDA